MTAEPRKGPCRRSEHPDRPHWHYGPAGRYWCTDRYSALLQQGDCDGVIYVRVTS